MLQYRHSNIVMGKLFKDSETFYFIVNNYFVNL